MESLERLGAVIDLGKKLVVQLQLADDVTSQWMAHMIAERINVAEKASLDERRAAQAACTEVILQLWDRRNNLAGHQRPFKGLEPLIRTIESLDVSSGQRFRYLPEQRPGLEGAPDDASKHLIKLAEGLDYSARALIHHFLAGAFEGAASEARPWIQAALDANADTVLEVRIVSFVANDVEDLRNEDKAAREAIEDKINRLEAFAELAATYARELRVKHRLTTEEDGEADR